MSNERKRYLLIFICENDLSEPIGGTFHVKEVAEAIGNRHPWFELIVPQYSRKSRLLLPDKVDIIKIQTPEFPVIKWVYFYLSSTITILFNKLKSREKIVVYSREMPFNIFLTLLCRILGLPLFIEVNGILIDEIKSFKRSFIEYYLTYIFERINFSACVRIISVSEGIKSEIRKHFKTPVDKVVVVYNGIKVPDHFNNPQIVNYNEIFKIDDAFIVGFIGSCYPYHDIFTLIEASPVIIKKFANVRFVVAGDGEMLESWKRRTKQLGIHNFFYFPGYIQKEKVPAFINAFDICLSLRSKNVEGPGMKIIEYLLYNKTVIATYNKETRKMFASFKNIYWAIPEDTHSVAKGIIEIIKHPDRFRDPESQKKILNQYTWDHTAQKILNTIEEALC